MRRERTKVRRLQWRLLMALTLCLIGVQIANGDFTTATLQERKLLSPDEIAHLRAQLQQKQREREAQANQREIIPLEAIDTIPELHMSKGTHSHAGQLAWIKLENDMARLRAVVTCEPENKTMPARRAPLIVQGDTWLALPTGRWGIQILVGLADGSRPLLIPPLTANLLGGHAYRLSFDRAAERELLRLITITNKKSTGEVTAKSGTDSPSNTPDTHPDTKIDVIMDKDE